MCSARKPMALPAALKRKLTIAPIRPGSAEAAFAPKVLSPFPNSVPSFFKALVIVPITAAIVTPAARNMAVTVTPYFLKISLILSRRGREFSLSDICALRRKRSSSLAAILSLAASLSNSDALTSSTTA